MFEKTEEIIKQFIEHNIFAGVTIKITKHNSVIFEKVFGLSDIDKKEKMQQDNIFSLYSLTKPVVVLGFLQLVDKHIITLDEKVCTFFPKFNPKITIKNLLTMTSGVTYFWSNNNSSKQVKELVELMESTNMSLQQFCVGLSEIKWDYQPAQMWHYGMNIDLIGGIIEQITNLPLHEYLQENIFDPIGMIDTAFFTKDMKRYTKVYDFYANEDKNILKEHKNWHWLMPFVDRQPNASLGGSGLFSTADDYSKFLNVLLTGEHNHKKIISREMLEQMSSNQLGELTNTFKWTLNEDYAYGYGVRVRIKNKALPLTEIGEFGWDGALGSAGLIDPKNELTMVFLSSSFPGNNKLVDKELFGAIYEDLRAQKIIH